MSDVNQIYYQHNDPMPSEIIPITKRKNESISANLLKNGCYRNNR